MMNDDMTYPIDKFRSLIGVTVGWTLLHYSFLFQESATAFSVLAQLRKAGEKNWNQCN